MIQIKGEDTDAALRDWVKSEITDASKKIYDLGKFLFSVSGTTAGLFLTLEKIGDDPQVDCLMVLSLCFFLASIILSLYLAIPKLWRLKPDANLRVAHKKKVERSIDLIWLWLILWLLGIFVGILAVS